VPRRKCFPILAVRRSLAFDARYQRSATVLIQDIEAADLPESLKDTLRAEHIGALAFIPLVANDAVIGKLVTYYDACHELGVAELALAVSIARQLGFSWRGGMPSKPLQSSRKSARN
jgi:GAF domain-containing protein